jgi:desulfoferrodoxin (superoxide reductase-like protein)
VDNSSALTEVKKLKIKCMHKISCVVTTLHHLHWLEIVIKAQLKGRQQELERCRGEGDGRGRDRTK